MSKFDIAMMGVAILCGFVAVFFGLEALDNFKRAKKLTKEADNYYEKYQAISKRLDQVDHERVQLEYDLHKARDLLKDSWVGGQAIQLGRTEGYVRDITTVVEFDPHNEPDEYHLKRELCWEIFEQIWPYIGVKSEYSPIRNQKVYVTQIKIVETKGNKDYED